MRRLATALAASVVVAACALPEASTSGASPSAREYPTGSNIPRRSGVRADSRLPLGDGVRVHSREDLERLQNSGHGAPRKGSGLSP